MKSMSILALLMIVVMAGCAGLAQQGRMENFSRIADAYERSLRTSDYNAAAQFLDPAILDKPPDLKKYSNIKVTDYQVTHVEISEDALQIKQDVDLQYFLLNSNRLHTVRNQQTWRYREKEKVWLLESGLPDFR